MESNELTHNAKAYQLDGLKGCYAYKPENPTYELIQGFSDKMKELYNLDIHTYFIEQIINGIGTEEITPDGSFSKRFIKKWKEYNREDPASLSYYPYKPVTEAAAVIGDLHKQIFSKKERTLYFRITSDIQNIYEDPDRDWGYGNPSSCWFSGGCYSDSPEILENAGGVALLLGTSEDVNVENGIGRIFLVNGKDGLTGFNAYLDLGDGRNRQANETLLFYAPIIAQILGYKEDETRKGTFTKDGKRECGFAISRFAHSPEEIYINFKKGLIFSPAIYPEIGSPFGYICEDCGCSLEHYEIFIGEDGETLCEYCFNDAYSICERCGDTISREYALSDEFGAYCEDCYHQTHELCEQCGEYFHRDHEIMEVTEDGDLLCEACYCEHMESKVQEEKEEEERKEKRASQN